METKSDSTHEDQQTPNSPTIKYMKDKGSQGNVRKFSVESQCDRANFCFNLSSTDYTVMRVYIDAINSSQIRLYYTKFTPKKKVGQICIVHGYGENTDDYLSMAEFFTKRGYVINMLDMRGFGYSGGERVNEPTKRVLSDIETLLRTCCQRELSTFIIAHGLGALFINALLQENQNLPIAGVINITPLLNFKNCNTGYTFQKVLSFLHPVFENLLVSNMINPTAVAKDPLAIKAKIDSHFWQSFITVKMAKQYQQVAQKVKAEGYKFSYPTLYCCGGMDLIQDLTEVRQYYNSLASPDKQMVVFEQGYHNLHSDYESEEMQHRILDWIEKRKNKLKWKKTLPFERGNIVRSNRFWPRAILAVIFLIALLSKLRVLIGILKRMGKF